MIMMRLAVVALGVALVSGTGTPKPGPLPKVDPPRVTPLPIVHPPTPDSPPEIRVRPVKPISPDEYPDSRYSNIYVHDSLDAFRREVDDIQGKTMSYVANRIEEHEEYVDKRVETHENYVDNRIGKHEEYVDKRVETHENYVDNRIDWHEEDVSKKIAGLWEAHHKDHYHIVRINAPQIKQNRDEVNDLWESHDKTTVSIAELLKVQAELLKRVSELEGRATKVEGRSTGLENILKEKVEGDATNLQGVNIQINAAGEDRREIRGLIDTLTKTNSEEHSVLTQKIIAESEERGELHDLVVHNQLKLQGSIDSSSKVYSDELKKLQGVIDSSNKFSSDEREKLKSSLDSSTKFSSDQRKFLQGVIDSSNKFSSDERKKLKSSLDSLTKFSSDQRKILQGKIDHSNTANAGQRKKLQDLIYSTIKADADERKKLHTLAVNLDSGNDEERKKLQDLVYQMSIDNAAELKKLEGLVTNTKTYNNGEFTRLDNKIDANFETGAGERQNMFQKVWKEIVANSDSHDALKTSHDVVSKEVGVLKGRIETVNGRADALASRAGALEYHKDKLWESHHKDHYQIVNVNAVRIKQNRDELNALKRESLSLSFYNGVSDELFKDHEFFGEEPKVKFDDVLEAFFCSSESNVCLLPTNARCYISAFTSKGACAIIDNGTKSVYLYSEYMDKETGQPETCYAQCFNPKLK